MNSLPSEVFVIFSCSGNENSLIEIFYWLFAYNLYSLYVFVYESVFVSINETQGPSPISFSLPLFRSIQSNFNIDHRLMMMVLEKQKEHWPSSIERVKLSSHPIEQCRKKTHQRILLLYKKANLIADIVYQHIIIACMWILYVTAVVDWPFL